MVKAVIRGGLAHKAGIKFGDTIISINGNKVKDFLSYKFYSADDVLDIDVRRKDETKSFHIVSGGEDLGIIFFDRLFDGVRKCANNCIFCFMRQLPDGLRDTLYLRDDDYRLSVMDGNYVTLTNMSERELDEVISMRLPRINISVHTTDAELRAHMLGNKNSDILPRIAKLAQNRIYMNCQIVLCRGVNDGEHLAKTLADLAQYYPYVQSVSVVPAGLTKFREGLPTLQKFDMIYAREVIKQVHTIAERNFAEVGDRFCYIADELYITAKLPIPKLSEYGDLLQLENGVGMTALFCREFTNELKRHGKIESNASKLIITGKAAYPYLAKLISMVNCPNIKLVAVENTFFGDSVTVAGLLTAGDIVAAIKQNPADVAIIPDIIFNHNGVTLDDKTLYWIRAQVPCKVEAIPPTGESLTKAIIVGTI